MPIRTETGSAAPAACIDVNPGGSGHGRTDGDGQGLHRHANPDGDGLGRSSGLHRRESAAPAFPPERATAMDRFIGELCRQLRRFTTWSASWPPSEQLEHAQEAATQLLGALKPLADSAINARGRYGIRKNLDQWRRTCRYTRGLLLAARRELDKLKKGQSLSKHWLVGAGLSDPRASVRSVSAWCEEFAIDKCSPICKSSVSTVRSAFGEVLRGINRQDVTKYAAGAAVGFVVIRHLHDEASMRLRSDLPAAPAAKGLARGRSSKVQNSVVTLHRNVVDEALPVILELQALGHKDAATLATAHRSVIDSIPPILASPEGRSVLIAH